jgi:hypothetical protein
MDSTGKCSESLLHHISLYIHAFKQADLNAPYIYMKKKKKGKTIPLTGCGGPQGCEVLRLPHFLDNWLTDGGEVVSLMHWLNLLISVRG